MKLSKPVVDSFDDDTFKIMLDHVLGYAIGGRPLAALIVSALRREPLNPRMAKLLEDVLSEHVLDNYPGSAEEYLKPELENGNLREAEKGVIRKALARSQAYLQALKDLPRLNRVSPACESRGSFEAGREQISQFDHGGRSEKICSYESHASHPC